jgi:hypothetical protein
MSLAVGPGIKHCIFAGLNFCKSLFLKRIISVLLLFVFLAPYVGKTIHHHNTRHDLISHHHENRVISENCLICNFEFCAFSIAKQPVFNQPERLISKYLFLLFLEKISITSSYSFLLRAPPV